MQKGMNTIMSYYLPYPTDIQVVLYYVAHYVVLKTSTSEHFIN